MVCENFGEIEAKGIAYPIQTFLVKNLLSNIKREEELITQLKGFNLSINFHEVGYLDKLYARELLEKTINKL
ncbi:hypothetical protein EF405_05955 [Cyclobacteriaceae bacterium YHN15]|nr:hypothetical protein EF405_05955 [Cyclobacteriaceae bacterium YHN15]